ncbi:g-patch domain protein [Ancylostoma caninum]|uniref:G-patch domain protein n=1 Tax=Ancylostoma caninum TaxID=29170 RepID=A0A368FG50_ANCCA|nr:g-patch domain protein [Ancylostoma caninum]
MAEEDEGMEAFDFDERDLEFALNPGRRHFQTKNQATYGIWADREESDEEDAYARPSFGKKAKKDYSAPINFISGGIKQGSSLEPPDKVKKEEKDDTPIEITFKKERKKRTAGANVFAGMRTSAVKGAVDPNVFGDWTKFGKGDVVKKMMKAMGYKEGEGLGASQQGIVEPVQATVRKGRGAIGAYGKEAAGPKFGESASDAQRRLGDQREPAQVEEPTMPQLKTAWKKASKASDSMFNKLFDTVYSSNAMLEYVLRPYDRTTALEYDLKQAKEMLDHEEKASERIKEVYELIEKKTSGSDILLLSLARMIPSNIHALQILEYFSKWRPLDPDHLIYGVDLMKEWRDILVDGENTSMFTDRLSAYDRLLWEGWLPSLRRASLDWDPRDHMEPMLRIIEMWLPVLPEWMKENILEQVIIPRIDDRVSSWDPLTDSVPIHSWLVPWLAVLGDRLQPVLAPIRQKLAKALRLWNPTDHSAMAILKPWCGVWTPATMSAFLAQNVVPKLEKCLDTMNLNPRENKKYEEWYACMSWMGMISPDTMASIVTKYFFPRWYAALCHWLDSPRVVLNEVKMWYREWDQRIPPQIRDFPTIKENLRRGMVALMESSQGLRVSSGPPPPPLVQAVPPPPPPVAMRPGMGVPISPHMSLKEVLERMAAQHDLTHIPQRDRLKEGRQVYWFGTQSIYLDRNIVYVLDTQTFSWRPVGMEELLQLAGVK